jgi:cell division protein ZapE
MIDAGDEPDTTVRQAMEFALAQRHGVADSSQLAAVARLDAFRTDWLAYKARRSNAVTKFLVHPPIPKGVFLWGGVGRGKSLLMDCFYATAPVVRKTRVHFHEFMRSVHREMDALRGTENPLDEVGLRVARQFRLICFDEFHVSDIADAMILHRLLVRLFQLRVAFVMTSNYAPDDLYPGGLHRDRLLPAIDLLKEKLDVVCVDSGRDYRLRELQREGMFFLGTGPSTDAQLNDAFNRIAECADESPLLRIEAREIPARRRAGGVVWFDYPILCRGPRSHSDYLEIAAQFHTVLLSNVPRLSSAQSFEARRLTWLVDILYDHRVKLILSSEAHPEFIYTDGALANEFQRTASRLIEMQSREYAAEPRRPISLL